MSVLSIQSRKTESPEAAEQLVIAAKRVSAVACVHRQLLGLDHLAALELQQFLRQLCENISEMLCDSDSPVPVVVEGVRIEVSRTLGVPLGCIVNELVINAAKRGKGKITFRLDTTPELGDCISVYNVGPSLPDGLPLGSSTRLGLRIIPALVKQINGRIEVGPGPGNEGRVSKVFFPTTAGV